MTTGPGARPLRADAQRNRARILAAAQKVLATDGLAAPIDKIADEAGVGVGTIYRHFPTQEALYEAVIVRALGELTDYADSLATAKDAGAAFFAFLTRLWDDVASMKAVADAGVGAGVDIKASAAGMTEEFVRAATMLLRRAQQSGAVRSDVETAEEVLALVSASCMAIEHLDAEQSRRILNIVFDGLRPR